MSEELIIQATELMREQTQAYGRLNQTCTQLTAVLAQSNPDMVSAVVRAGETELLEMRARLLRLMFKLTKFADARAAAPDAVPISPAVRTAFSQASNELQTAAQEYQRLGGRASALAINGAIFSAVNIELFGIQPTTYRAPYARRGEGRTWG
ncbi:MAG TPA: hypothetical protein VFZ34_23180 [Blastocatellia bacterium]|nr:hypothetical protein [Blastocatellia bacterium]